MNKILNKMIEFYNNPSLKIYIGDKFQSKSQNIFIDFETLDDRIYYIGIGISSFPLHFEYKNIVSNQNTEKEQLRILFEFSNFLQNYKDYNVYYWSAEKRFYNRVKNVPKIDYSNWIDLCETFQQLPIIVQGAYDFKLKTIAKNMKKLSMIEIELPKDCQSGEESMVIAKEYYENYDMRHYLMLFNYNYFDTRVLYEIINYLLTT